MLFHDLIILVLLVLLIALIAFFFLRMVLAQSLMKNSSNVVRSRGSGLMSALILGFFFFCNVFFSIASGLVDSETQSIANSHFIKALWLGWILLLVQGKVTNFLAQQLSKSTSMDFKKLLHLVRLFYLLTVAIIIALGFASFALWI